MREELVPEADALARALDQPRHVGDDKLPPVGRLDRAEHGLQGRERVVGDLRARVREARRSDDLPAFGRPTRPRRRGASAAARVALVAGGPTSAKRGACRVELTKRALPRPPWPPRASTTRALGCARSAIRSPSSRTCVPIGTRSSTSSPSAPCLRRRGRSAAPGALIQRRRWSAERSRSAGSATRRTSPPSPPSPPSGPPLGTNFSRRKLKPAVAALAGLDVDPCPVVEHGQRGTAGFTRPGCGLR